MVWVSGGFTLGCRFDYVDTDGDHDSRLLRFRLNGQGLITRIDDGGGESIVPVFFAVRVTKGIPAALAQDQLAHNAANLDADQRPSMGLLAKSPEPQEIRFNSSICRSSPAREARD